MTVVVDTDEYGARRLEAHLYKLVPVRRVDNITAAPSISATSRSSRWPPPARRARTSCSSSTSTARGSSTSARSRWSSKRPGTEDKIDSLLEVLRPYGVIEMVRTGRSRWPGEVAGDKSAPRAAHTAPAEASDVSSGSV